SHIWNNLLDWEPPGATFDYNFYLDWMVQHHQNFMRMWATETTHALPTVYPQTGPGTTMTGGPKFDTSQLDQVYFDRLRSRVIAAGDRGIYVSIMLFQGWSIEDKGDGNPWPGHWFNAANNINGVDGDVDGNGDGHEVHTLAIPAITSLQEAYVRKVVDTVNDLDNVLYEIANESNYDSPPWQHHMVDVIHKYEAGRKQHPVGMSCVGDNAGGPGALSTFLESHADWIAPCGPMTW